MGEREGNLTGKVANATPEPPIAPGSEGATELALAQRAASGDHQAFATLVHFYEPRLIAYLTPMLGDREAAHDVVQETFLAAFRALPRWRPLTPTSARPSDDTMNATAATTQATSGAAHPLSPWLYRIATNQALSLLRARPPTPIRAPGGDLPEGARPLTGAPAGMSFEDRYAARELLQSALRRLSTDDAACLVLHFVAGERYAEIGARLGMSAEAVRKRVARGLTALRAIYTTLDVEAPQ